MTTGSPWKGKMMMIMIQSLNTMYMELKRHNLKPNRILKSISNLNLQLSKPRNTRSLNPMREQSLYKGNRGQNKNASLELKNKELLKDSQREAIECERKDKAIGQESRNPLL